MDALARVFETIRVNPFSHFSLELAAPWGFAIEARQRALYCMIGGRSCELLLPDSTQRLLLEPGDLVVLPRAGRSVWRSDAAARVVPFERLMATLAVQRGQRLVRAGQSHGEATVLTGGAFWTSEVSAHPVLGALPAVVHLQHQQTPTSDWMSPLTALMHYELARQGAGSEAMLKRLSDMLLIHAVQASLATRPDAAPSWLGGLIDGRIAPAIKAIHAHPERDWSVDALARMAAMSRTAFAVRFRQVTGETPLQYLTRWRMYLAARQLRETPLSTEAISARVGYKNSAAFQKAFKRIMGVPPGEYRRRPAQP